MVEFQDTRLDAIFHALGDPTRRLMIRRLAEGERTVGQLAEPLSMSLAAASKHIRALEGAGLIAREVQGRVHVCRLNAAPLAEANDWLRTYEKFWSTRLDRLETLLRQADAAACADHPAALPAEPAPSRPGPSARNARSPSLRNRKRGPR